MNRGESESVWKLSRRQKKGGTFIFIALIIGFFAYGSYTSGNVELAQALGVIAAIAFVLGLVD